MALAGLENTTGTKIYVALGEPATYTAAALATLGGFEQVIGVVTFGEWGDQETDVSEPLLAEGRVIHTTGTADGGTVAISIQTRDTDAGSDIIKAAGGTNEAVTIMKVYASGDGEVATGVFMSARFRDASGNSVRGYSTSAMLNTGVTELSAADVTTALA
ncbi:MAG: hypothetical protein Unbinned338contig1000_50 [Prokaryotic dsDNA virus sp.]|nr:MAG: hypothetical protein Unbinned338contig1000_50 [Prokaryotic dsDNA virus sp.]|tara:strand:+ start:29481 stop:29960 length:480 start_codon:yes stop_codon:yes gene_type:complete